MSAEPTMHEHRIGSFRIRQRSDDCSDSGKAVCSRVRACGCWWSGRTLAWRSTGSRSSRR